MHIDEAQPSKRKLSYFSFIWTTFLLTSAGAYGFEYAVSAVGVGYSLLLVTLFAVFYAFPIALISSELSGLMPSRHGQIIWAYRAFYKINHGFGDFIGYLNAANVVIFWILNTAAHPIVLTQYLTTMTGPLSTTVMYLIKFAVILSGIIVNSFEFSVIAHITSILCVVMMLPFCVAFFWTLPRINPTTQWPPCGLDWPLAITTCVWEYAGFESLGSIVQEIGFPTKRLYSAFLFAILADLTTLLIPILSAATLANDRCFDWFDGFFAVGYGHLTKSLEYSVTVGAVVINWCIYVTALGVVSRMLWATAQPYFEIKTDGAMVLSQANLASPRDQYGRTRIAINILPKRFIGELYHHTGRPIYATVAISVFVALANISMDFGEMVEFNLFTYFVFFCIELCAYLILKHTEPDTPRIFEIPGGTLGGWATVILLLLSYGTCFWVMAFEKPVLLAIAVAMNGMFTFYYIGGKLCCHRMYQHDIFEDMEDFETYVEAKHDSTQRSEIVEYEYEPLI